MTKVNEDSSDSWIDLIKTVGYGYGICVSLVFAFTAPLFIYFRLSGNAPRIYRAYILSGLKQGTLTVYCSTHYVLDAALYSVNIPFAFAALIFRRIEGGAVSLWSFMVSAYIGLTVLFVLIAWICVLQFLTGKMAGGGVRFFEQVGSTCVMFVALSYFKVLFLVGANADATLGAAGLLIGAILPIIVRNISPGGTDST